MASSAAKSFVAVSGVTFDGTAMDNAQAADVQYTQRRVDVDVEADTGPVARPIVRKERFITILTTQVNLDFSAKNQGSLVYTVQDSANTPANVTFTWSSAWFEGYASSVTKNGVSVMRVLFAVFGDPVLS